MRRNGRRHADDYLENEELNEIYEEYEEFDIEADPDAEDEAYVETEEASPKKNVWVKIGKVALVILVLIALFFVSMKVTEIVLDRNQEPDYSSDAPAYSDDSDLTDDENIPVIDTDTEDENIAEEDEEETEFKEYKEKDTTPVKKPEEAKTPEGNKKPEEDKKPVETEKPEETKKPSTEPTPSTPSKPVITPGNPAA